MTKKIKPGPTKKTKEPYPKKSKYKIFKMEKAKGYLR